MSFNCQFHVKSYTCVCWGVRSSTGHCGTGRSEKIGAECENRDENPLVRFESLQDPL